MVVLPDARHAIRSRFYDDNKYSELLASVPSARDPTTDLIK